MTDRLSVIENLKENGIPRVDESINNNRRFNAGFAEARPGVECNCMFLWDILGTRNLALDPFQSNSSYSDVQGVEGRHKKRSPSETNSCHSRRELQRVGGPSNVT